MSNRAIAIFRLMWLFVASCNPAHPTYVYGRISPTQVMRCAVKSLQTPPPAANPPPPSGLLCLFSSSWHLFVSLENPGLGHKSSAASRQLQLGDVDIVFVLDIADDLLQHVFQRDET